METIAITNHKGGVGKTTTAINLAAALAQRSAKVLLLDLDAQAHATLGLGVDPYGLRQSLYEVLTRPRGTLGQVIVPTALWGLDLAPSSVLLSGAEVHLLGRRDRQFVLARRLQPLQGDYDYAIIDCSPSLNILTINAMVASSAVIIPIQAHYYALEGLKQLAQTLTIVRQRYHPALRIRGLLLTMMERQTRLAQDVEQQMRGHFGELVLRTVIRRDIRLAEAPSAGQSIQQYAPESAGAADYEALATEISYEQKKERLAQGHLRHI